MRLPAKIEYACMAVLELALRYQGNVPVQLADIAGTQNIPEKFLIQILQRLKSANIVGSARGMAGGYFLAKDPSLITMADVIRSVDNNILDIPSEAEMAGASRGREIILKTWGAVSSDVAGQLERITFESLVNRLKNEQLTYYI